MAMGTKYLSSNRSLSWDYRFGYRTWGLVLYGAFPASLSALGVINLPKFEGFTSLLPLFIIAFVPVLILFLLIKQRLSAWYLLADRLWLRSIIITSTILILSTAICFATGILKGVYTLITWNEWRAIDLSLRWTPALESILLAIVTLVGSSTLFLTAIKDTGGLPALPSVEFSKELKTLRDALSVILNEKIWNDSEGCEAKSLKDNLAEAEKLASSIKRRSPPKSGRNIFYESLECDLARFETARSRISNTPTKWPDLFEISKPASTISLNPDDQKLREAINRIREIKINA